MLATATVRIGAVLLLALSGVLGLVTAGLTQAALGQVRINEVDYEDNWVEFYNAGTSTVDVSSYQLCSEFTYSSLSGLNTLSGSTSMDPGAFLVVEWNNLPTAEGSVGLYEDTQFTQPSSMLDYMQYGNTGQPRESVAINAGEWESGEFVPLAPSGKTLSFFNTAGEVGEEDWNESNETQGSANDPIPVELASFDASADGKTVRLTWQTASETNNAGFEVQHRTETSTFEVEAFVEGEGTTSNPQKYRHVVSDLAPGTHTFRLRQVDRDGSSTLTHTVTATISLQSSARLSPLRPTPTTSTAHLSLAVRETQPVTIRLYDLLGRSVTTVYDGVLREGPARRFVIETQRLSSGTYVLRASGSSFVETRKIVVAK